jgi:ketosteroid isomerase-like protein
VGNEEEAPVSLEEEKNKALVRRFWEAVARGDIDAIDELLAADFVDHSTLAGQGPGREGYKQQSPNSTLPSLMFDASSRTS